MKKKGLNANFLLSLHLFWNLWLNQKEMNYFLSIKALDAVLDRLKFFEKKRYFVKDCAYLGVPQAPAR